MRKEGEFAAKARIPIKVCWHTNCGEASAILRATVLISERPYSRVLAQKSRSYSTNFEADWHAFQGCRTA
jgi:hypothetical protein